MNRDIFEDMRHIACTRMAERRMDIKVLQYIMGHAHYDVTMEVYNHLGDMSGIEKELANHLFYWVCKKFIKTLALTS